MDRRRIMRRAGRVAQELSVSSVCRAVVDVRSAELQLVKLDASHYCCQEVLRGSRRRSREPVKTGRPERSSRLCATDVRAEMKTGARRTRLIDTSITILKRLEFCVPRTGPRVAVLIGRPITR